MWPLYFLLNKVLNVEVEIGEEWKEGGVGSGSAGHGGSREEDCVNAGGCHLTIDPFLIGRKFREEDLPCSQFIDVPHINQLRSWDCGLACVLMALNTIGIKNWNLQALIDLCCTTSIWTVDLAYLLQKFAVSFSYFTVTLGANPSYSAETFYKEQLPTDLVRVDMLFKRAVDEGINIECRSINEKEISLLILSGKYIAIALVDQYKLSRSLLGGVLLTGLSINSGYAGHYVLICGYDAGADEFEIRDPASSRKHERIPSKCLEEARKSFGTDEDLLLISLEKSNKQNSSSHQLSSCDSGTH